MPPQPAEPAQTASLTHGQPPVAAAPFGKSALVLGGAQGIGYDLARLLCAQGLRLVLTDPDNEAAQMAGRSLGQNGMACDPAVGRDMAKLAYEAGDMLGDIDILVLALASPLPPGGSAAISEADFTTHLRAQSLPLLQLARHFVPGLRARRRGAVLVLAQSPSRPDPWQDAATAWLTSATQALAQEWAEAGLTLNTLFTRRADAPVLPKFMTAAGAPRQATNAHSGEIAQTALAFCRVPASLTGQVLHLPRPR